MRTKTKYLAFVFGASASVNPFTFIYSSSACVEELEEYFRTEVYAKECGEILTADTDVDIVDLQDCRDYIEDCLLDAWQRSL